MSHLSQIALIVISPLTPSIYLIISHLVKETNISDVAFIIQVMIPKITMQAYCICGMMLSVAFIILYYVGITFGMGWLMIVFLLIASVYLSKAFIEEVYLLQSDRRKKRLYAIVTVCCIVFIIISTIIGLNNL